MVWWVRVRACCVCVVKTVCAEESDLVIYCNLISRPYSTGEPIRSVYHSTSLLLKSGSMRVLPAPIVSWPMLYVPSSCRHWNATFTVSAALGSHVVYTGLSQYCVGKKSKDKCGWVGAGAQGSSMSARLFVQCVHICTSERRSTSGLVGMHQVNLLGIGATH